MKIADFADAHGLDIVLRRRGDTKVWTARLMGCKVRGRDFCFAIGATANAALKAYVEAIRGRTLVFNDGAPGSLTVQVPEDLKTS